MSRSRGRAKGQPAGVLHPLGHPDDFRTKTSSAGSPMAPARQRRVTSEVGRLCRLTRTRRDRMSRYLLVFVLLAAVRAPRNSNFTSLPPARVAIRVPGDGCGTATGQKSDLSPPAFTAGGASTAKTKSRRCSRSAPQSCHPNGPGRRIDLEGRCGRRFRPSPVSTRTWFRPFVQAATTSDEVELPGASLTPRSRSS